MKTRSAIIRGVLFLLITTSAFGITGFQSATTQDQYKQSLEYYRTNQYDSAIHFAEVAGKSFFNAKNWTDYIHSQNHLARCLYQKEELNQSLSVLRSNLSTASKWLGQKHSQTILTMAELSVAFEQWGQLDSASYYSNLAIELATSAVFEDSIDLVTTYRLASSARMAKEEHHVALSYLTKAFDLISGIKEPASKELAELHHMRGLVYRYTYKFDQSREEFEKALELVDRGRPANKILKAKYLKNLGSIYIYLDDLRKSEQILRKSLDLLLTYADPKGLKVMTVINEIGKVYFFQHHNKEAVDHLSQSLKTFEEKLPPLHPKTAVTHTMIARAYQNLRDNLTAEQHLIKALAITRDLYGISNHLARATAKLGEVYYLMEKDDRCRNLYMEALNIASSLSPKDPFTIAAINESLAILERVIGNTEEAIALQLQNADLYRARMGENSLDLAFAYRSLSMLFYGDKDYEQALFYAQKALMAIVVGFDNEDPHINPELNSNFSNKIVTLKVLRYKAKSLFLLFESTKNIDYFNSGMNTCNLALDLIDKMRAETADPSSQIFLDKQLDEMVDVGLKSATNTEEKVLADQIKARLFLLVERVNCSALRLQLEESKARELAGIPDDLQSEEARLKQNIAAIQVKLNNVRDTAALQSLSAELIFASQELEGLIDQFEIDYPKYYRTKYDVELIDIEDVSHQLGENQNIVQYKLTNEAIYVFVLNATGIFMKVVPIDIKNLGQQISNMTKSVQERNQEKYTQLAVELYKVLIEPMRSKLTGDHLIIIPDDQLWRVNFDLLLASEPSSLNYAGYDYLLKQYAISYAYSLNLIYNQNIQKKNKNATKEVLAFSYSERHQGELSLNNLRSKKLSQLPGAAEEVKKISTLYQGDYFFGEMASETRFKQDASKYAILHLAIHGEADTKTPGNSKLYFKSKADSTEDGQLFAHELYNMNLNADLAVLSACNTGTGQLVNGEGLMSMARAFTYSGVSSLATTLWDIPDESSSTIIEGFYAGLKNGYSKSEALRQSKLSYLKASTPVSADPYYWGGYVIIGNIDALRNHQAPWLNSGLIFLLIIGLVVGTAKFYRYRTKS